MASRILRCLVLSFVCGTLPSCGAPAGDLPAPAPAAGPAPAAPSGSPAASSVPAGSAPATGDAKAPGILIGSVLEIDAPRAGTLVQLMARDGLLLQATVDERGEYQISDVPPGDYLLNVVDIPAVRSGVMTMKSRGITVGPGELVEQNFVFGTGYRVLGTIEGIPEGVAKVLIALYRPGAPRVAGTALSDRTLPLEAAKYLAGSTYVEGTSAWQISDVEPGSYRLEVTVPPDPATPRSEAWPPPLFEAEVTVGERDLERPIVIGRP